MHIALIVLFLVRQKVRTLMLFKWSRHSFQKYRYPNSVLNFEMFVRRQSFAWILNFLLEIGTYRYFWVERQCVPAGLHMPRLSSFFDGWPSINLWWFVSRWSLRRLALHLLTSGRRGHGIKHEYVIVDIGTNQNQYAVPFFDLELCLYLQGRVSYLDLFPFRSDRRIWTPIQMYDAKPFLLRNQGTLDLLSSYSI